MRQKISLYIADNLIDLSDDNLVLLNYTFEDLSNPTVIKNSYSRKITIPGTRNNDRVFGSLWRLDRKTIIADNAFTGPYFDATAKANFKIYNDRSELLMTGYCKVESINREGDDISYNINLYGGLGEFFYNLSYNADGTKRTLLDLVYSNMDGDSVNGVDIKPGVGRGVVLLAWTYLENPDEFIPGDRSDLFYNIINFAPCYNGLPADFDANKAICRFDEFKNVPYQQSVDGRQYRRKDGTDSLLLTFSSKHTEWDMMDLRWYLQRPVINLQSIFNAICDPANNGGYQVRMNFPPVHDVWLTLPMIPTKYRNDIGWVNQVLKGTMTPADVLISYAKMYGLVFVMDQTGKTLNIYERKGFFSKMGEVIDMTGRIDTASVTINPNVADHRYYQMGGGKAEGQFAKDYRKDFNRDYGIQRINTGYDFDLETKEITKDLKFAEAVDVTEYSKGFVTTELTYPEYRNLPQPNYESVEVQLWDYYDQNKSMNVPVSFGNYVYIDATPPYSDWLPKVQFHEEENKPTKGENVLLFFNGFVSTPLFAEQLVPFNKQYMISEDTRDMMFLNNNRPCWTLWGWKDKPDDPYIRTSLPSFLRDKVDINSIKWNVIDTFDFGVPLAVGTQSIFNPNDVCIYNKSWKKYLSDRYDLDTKVMRCKADLNGFTVDRNLLGRFFWYENSIWVLNKIENYSLTSDDLVDCEFVKVKDIKNYTE